VGRLALSGGARDQRPVDHTRGTAICLSGLAGEWCSNEFLSAFSGALGSGIDEVSGRHMVAAPRGGRRRASSGFVTISLAAQR